MNVFQKAIILYARYPVCALQNYMLHNHYEHQVPSKKNMELILRGC